MHVLTGGNECFHFSRGYCLANQCTTGSAGLPTGGSLKCHAFRGDLLCFYPTQGRDPTQLPQAWGYSSGSQSNHLMTGVSGFKNVLGFNSLLKERQPSKTSRGHKESLVRELEDPWTFGCNPGTRGTAGVASVLAAPSARAFISSSMFGTTAFKRHLM